MYQSIAKVYDYIFPQNNTQLSFINSIKPITQEEHVLEIGAATGNLTELLSTCTNNVQGLDLDDTLLTVAKAKYPNISFINENMLSLDQLDKHFNRIVCFGNTLVHLPNREDVKVFFENVYEQLVDDGLFVVQIINYDRIVNQHINHLPTIENEHIIFIRDYDIKSDHVIFNTELTIKETSQVLKNAIPLLTLRKNEIQSYLQSVGFKDIMFYGNLKGDKLKDNDIPLLFSCTK